MIHRKIRFSIVLLEMQGRFKILIPNRIHLMLSLERIHCQISPWFLMAIHLQQEVMCLLNINRIIKISLMLQITEILIITVRNNRFKVSIIHHFLWVNLKSQHLKWYLHLSSKTHTMNVCLYHHLLVKEAQLLQTLRLLISLFQEEVREMKI